MAVNFIDNPVQDLMLLNTSPGISGGTKQSKFENPGNRIDRSFEDLLNSNNTVSDEYDDVEINIEVKTPENNNNDKPVANKEENSGLKPKDEHDKDKKAAKNIGKNGEVKNIEEQNLTKKNEKTGEKKNISEILSGILNVDNRHSGNAGKNETTNIKIKLSDLDRNSKESIKAILKDYNSGKINGKEAESIILDVLAKSNIGKSGIIDRKNVTAISIEKQKPATGLAGHVHFGETIKSDKQVNDKKDEKSIGLKLKSSAGDKRIARKDDAKKILSEEKVKEAEIKDIKSEIRLDLNDNKQNDRNTNVKSSDYGRQILNDNKEKIFDNIARNTKIVLANNETRFSTMIRPENFGRIDMKFTVKDGKVEGRMILQNQEAADFFKANVEELRAVFSKSNVEMGNINISLAGQGFAGHKGNDRSDADNGEKVDFIQNLSKVAKTFDDNNVSDIVYNNNDVSSVNIFI